MSRFTKRLSLLTALIGVALTAGTASPAGAHPLGASLIQPCGVAAAPSTFAVNLAVPTDSARAGDREPSA